MEKDMIVLRSKNKKILYLHGKDEEWKYPPGNNIIFDELSKWFDVDFADVSSNPKFGLDDFHRVDFTKYCLIVGFSMGGLYATCIKNIPVVLVNPGIGIEKIWPEFKKVSEESKSNKKLNLKRIFISAEDKHKDFLLPNIIKQFGEEKIEYIPSAGHVLTTEEVREYLVNYIKKIQ